jgi:hypothetical protein
VLSVRFSAAAEFDAGGSMRAVFSVNVKKGQESGGASYSIPNGRRGRLMTRAPLDGDAAGRFRAGVDRVMLPGSPKSSPGVAFMRRFALLGLVLFAIAMRTSADEKLEGIACRSVHLA